MAVNTLELVVRSLHILSGVLWVGGALYAGLVVSRTLMGATPGTRAEAMRRIGPTGFRVLMYAGTSTILFGLWQQYLLAGAVRFQGSTWNVLMGATLFVAIAMLGIAGAVIMPALRKMGALTPETASQAPAIQKRLMMGSMLNMALGVLAVILMVWAVLERSRPAI